jgi:hypothetical protein
LAGRRPAQIRVRFIFIFICVHAESVVPMRLLFFCSTFFAKPIQQQMKAICALISEG